jgi:hypothetical protein
MELQINNYDNVQFQLQKVHLILCFVQVKL